MDSAAFHSLGSDESAMASADEMYANRRCCCFFTPWPGAGDCKAWERIRSSDGASCPASGRRWWARGLKALLKVREWSELVAGRRWKTFIRRRRRRSHGSFGSGGSGKQAHGGRFGYDPSSYALNFDEGQGSDDDGDTVRRGFSARFAVTPPASAKSSMDLGGGH